MWIETLTRTAESSTDGRQLKPSGTEAEVGMDVGRAVSREEVGPEEGGTGGTWKEAESFSP